MDYLDIAMNFAKELGVDYADIRIQKTRSEVIYLRNLSLKNTSNNVVYGYGIRVLKNGAWGFAHSNIFSENEVIDTVKKALEIAENSAKIKVGEGIRLAPERSYIDKYETKVIKDPFEVPLKEKIDLMMEANKIMLNFGEIKEASFFMQSQTDEKLFASTIGTRLDIKTTFVYPRFTATAVADGDSQDVLTETKRRDLIIDPIHLSLTMHESVGHPTELDRVLGWEADMAGLSFATPEKLKNYRYGSEIVNLVGDNTLGFGLATAGYDDDGVPGQKWHIIKNGILNEYGTTRDTAPFIGDESSRGCNRATYYYNFPINRIPNLYLEPGKQPLSPQELIADTEDGIYIEGQGSFSIDQHRVNFQFGGDLFWEIKNGKKTRMLKKVLYKSNNPEFWNSCDAICDERYWKSFGITNCGKGQPGQTGRMTHGASTARFKNIRVGGSK